MVGDAEAQYLAFFASKTVGMIRAPDSYVYPAPFNLIEAVFIAPFELAFQKKKYPLLNATDASLHDQVYSFVAVIQCPLCSGTFHFLCFISII